MSHNSVFFRHFATWIFLVGCSTVEIELCWIVGVFACENHVAVSTSDVESLLETKSESLVTYGNSAFSLAYIKDAYLAASCEKVGLQGVDSFEL